MAAVKNISTGARGAYAKGVLVMAEVGEVVEADDFNDEWFELDGESEGGELGDMKVADLKSLAEAEGADISGLTKKADIVSAIELAREATESKEEEAEEADGEFEELEEQTAE